MAHARALATRMRVLAPFRQLHLLADGNWWDVDLDRMVYGRLDIDVIERAELSSLPRTERYDRSGVYAVAIRALSRRRIKALALRG